MSAIREIALAKAIGGSGGGSSVTIEELTVNQNGTVTAPEGKAFNPVITMVGDTRTLLASWDFKSETPLVDAVGGKELTNIGCTFSSKGCFIPRYTGTSASGVGVGQGQKKSVYISLADLLSPVDTLYGKDIEVDIGAWNRYMEGTNNYATRLLLVKQGNGLVYRMTTTESTRGWGIYDTVWGSEYVRSSMIEFSTVKLQLADDDTGIDKVFVNGILDRILKKLNEENVIVKKGIGLLDS